MKDINALALELFDKIKKVELEESANFIGIFDNFAVEKELTESETRELADIVFPMALKRLTDLLQFDMLDDIKEDARQDGLRVVKGGKEE